MRPYGGVSAKGAPAFKGTFLRHPDVMPPQNTRGVVAVRFSDRLRGRADLQPANDFHEVIHFFVCGGFAGFEVLLHADAGEECQDEFRERYRPHRGFRGFDISGDEIPESGAALQFPAFSASAERIGGIDAHCATRGDITR